MQENTKVVTLLGACVLALAAMSAVAWWLLSEDSPTPPPLTDVSLEMITDSQIDVARRAVGTSGIIEVGLDRFRLRMGRFPRDLSELLNPPENPEEAKLWSGPYIHNPQLLADPWKKPYRILAPGTHNTDRFDLWSAGPDGIDGTEDDIGNW